MLCLARIDPCGRVAPWVTESSRFAYRNLSGAVALKTSFKALIGWILLAPEDLGLLVALTIFLELTRPCVCSNLLSAWVLLLNWAKN